MGSMDQQGLHGEIEGCSRPSDRKVLGDNLRITAACARRERSLTRILRPLFCCQHSEGLSSDPQKDGGGGGR